MAVPERRSRHWLGGHLRTGVRLRSMPQIETPWIGTFNLRWWQYADQEQAAVSPDVDEAGEAVAAPRSKS